MNIYKNLLVSSTIFISISCFAIPDFKEKDIQTRTEPQLDKFLGRKMDFSNGLLFKDEVLSNIELGDDSKRVVLNKDKMDVTFFTDPKDNFNKIKANIGLDFYVNDIKQPGEYNLNLHCSVIQEKYIEDKLLHNEQVKNHEKILTYNLIFNILESKVVDQGSFSFSFSPNDVSLLKIEETDTDKEQLRLEHTSPNKELLRMNILNICQFIDLDLQMLDISRNVRTEIIPLK